MNVPNARELDNLLLRAQANWAKSVALLALGDTAGADAALQTADHDLQPLRSQQISPIVALWMEARIERQRGRLAARTGNWAVALAAYDRSADALRQSAHRDQFRGRAGGCAASAGTCRDLAAARRDRAKPLRAEYARALDALIDSGMPGGVPPAGLEQYLDLLVEHQHGVLPTRASEEDFFRAMQAVNKPAIERQMNRIRSILQADPVVGSRLRDRADLERELTRLRYQLAELDPAQQGQAADLERRRAAARISSPVSTPNSLRTRASSSTMSSPRRCAKCRSALRPDEAYFKLTELRGKDYAILITPNDTMIYRIDAPPRRSPHWRRACAIRSTVNRRGPTGAVRRRRGLYAVPADRGSRGGQASAGLRAGGRSRRAAGAAAHRRSRHRPGQRRKYKAAAASDKFDFSSVSFLAREPNCRRRCRRARS